MSSYTWLPQYKDLIWSYLILSYLSYLILSYLAPKFCILWNLGQKIISTKHSTTHYLWQQNDCPSYVRWCIRYYVWWSTRCSECLDAQTEEERGWQYLDILTQKKKEAENTVLQITFIFAPVFVQCYVLVYCFNPCLLSLVFFSVMILNFAFFGIWVRRSCHTSIQPYNFITAERLSTGYFH